MRGLGHERMADRASSRLRGERERGAALPPMTLEILYVALVLFGLFARCECPEIAAFPGLFVDPARIDPILAIFQLPDHFPASAMSARTLCAVRPLARSNTRLRFSDNPRPARLM